MSPRIRGRVALAALAIVAGLLVAACGAAPMPSGPLGPCEADKADAVSAGGYPEIEEKLPTSLGGRAPDVVNSGRSCTDKALGSLVTHGVRQLSYAGATWNEGQSDGTVIAMLTSGYDSPQLELAWVEEFYTAGAVAATKTDNVKTSRPTMGFAGQVFRLEALNDLSQQTVVVWGQPSFVHVVIVVTQVDPNASRAAHDARVAAAVDAAMAGRPVQSDLP